MQQAGTGSRKPLLKRPKNMILPFDTTPNVHFLLSFVVLLLTA
jgi:hypothetical protein